MRLPFFCQNQWTLKRRLPFCSIQRNNDEKVGWLFALALFLFDGNNQGLLRGNCAVILRHVT